MGFALVQTLLRLFDHLLPTCVITETVQQMIVIFPPSEISLSVSFMQSDLCVR